MVDFLYNGVRLPDIFKVYTPEVQKTHPFAAITVAREADGSIRYQSTFLQLFAQNAYYFWNNEKLFFGGNSDGEAVAYKVHNCKDGVWSEGTEYERDYSARIYPLENVFANGSGRWLTWTNFNAEYEGTLYLAASDPVPFYGWETLWDGKPEKDGGVDGDNGDFFWLWYSSEGNKNRLSIGDVVRVTVDGTVSTLTVSAGTNDKFAKAGNEWLENNSAADDGTDIYFWEYNGALRFFTRKVYSDEMPHVKFERAITSPVQRNPAELMTGYLAAMSAIKSRR